jgi:hypothetical protein
LDRPLGRSTAGYPLRRWTIRTTRWRVAVTAGILTAGCVLGPGVKPSPLRGYRVLIESRDSLSDQLARALARKGFTVRRNVRGGSLQTAALVTFTFRELGSTPTIWLHARLADTRSGAVVAAVSVPFDSLGPTPELRARALADSFATRLEPRRIPSP